LLRRHQDAIDNIKAALAGAVAPPPPADLPTVADPKLLRNRRKKDQSEVDVPGSVGSATPGLSSIPRAVPASGVPNAISGVIDVPLVIAGFHNLAVEQVFVGKYQSALTAVERAVELAIARLPEACRIFHIFAALLLAGCCCLLSDS